MTKIEKYGIYCRSWEGGWSNHPNDSGGATMKGVTYLMEIDDVFCITGKGTIVTGKIKKGYVEVGDEVSLKGKDISEATVVTGIEKFRKVLNKASVGENVGINLRGIDHKKVHRGDILCSID